MIFSRDRRNTGRHALSHGGVTPPERAGEPATESGDRRDRSGAHADATAGAGRASGPYDIAQAPDDGRQRIDLGALRLPAVDGIEIRVQANPEGQIQQILLVHGDSALQLSAFAAPRTEGIWTEVRADIRDSLLGDGYQADEIDGEFGPELRTRVSSPQGPTDLRFVGIDGPRWFVRGVYQGAAAADPSNAGPLREVLRELVVDRGGEAMPVREALPLRLPPAMDAATKTPAGQAATAAGGANGALAGLTDALPAVGGRGAGSSRTAKGRAAPGQPPRTASPRPRLET